MKRAKINGVEFEIPERFKNLKATCLDCGAEGKMYKEHLRINLPGEIEMPEAQLIDFSIDEQANKNTPEVTAKCKCCGNTKNLKISMELYAPVNKVIY